MAGTMAAGRGKRMGIVGINVTPMVDVVLVLLIIMMVSATYIVSQSLKVELPKSSTSDEAAPAITAVTLTKEGKLYFNQQPVEEPELVNRLRAAKAANPDVSLVITADGAALHGMVVHLIDLAKQEDITKFAINVQREE
jgi:biopolymer transport protein ExbD